MTPVTACIPLCWKSQHPPTIAQWLRRVDDTGRMEDLTLTSQQRQETYIETWGKLNIFKYSVEGIALRGGSRDAAWDYT